MFILFFLFSDDNVNVIICCIRMSDENLTYRRLNVNVNLSSEHYVSVCD